jgi:dienelactone hydrolase
MTSFASLRTQRTTLRTMIRVVILVTILLGCLPVGRMGATAQTKNAAQQEQRFFEPEVEIQKEDYARVRRRFRTKLLRKGPAPQEWQPYQVPADISEVEFTSGKLRLKAWINRPRGPGPKRPAVLFLHGGFAFGPPDWKMAQPYRDAGYVVMVPLLRSENGQPGSFSMFYDEVDDVLAAAEFLRKQPSVDTTRIYVAGHSAGGTMALLAALASKLFRAAAAFDGSPDQQLLFGATGSARRSWIPREVTFDHNDLRELQVRSPLAYARSFKCPTRLYYSTEAMSLYQGASIRTAATAKGHGLDVEAIKMEGTHFSHVASAMKQSIEFFRRTETKK